MVVLTDEIYNTRMSIRDKVNINDMNDDAKKFYFKLYSFYMDLMYQYLIKKTAILDYDDFLIGKGYKMVPNEEQDFYQIFSQKNLKFFYIRNNIYLERLTNEEIEFLGNKIGINDSSLDKGTEILIEKTYRKLIFENVSGDYNSNFEVNFGPDSPMFYVPVDALVIGVRYNEKIDGNNMKNYLIKRDFVERLNIELSKNISTLLNVPVAVICYDDNSVKKNNNVNNSYNK